MTVDFEKMAAHDPSGFVVLADFIPGIIQEIRYHSTYNFIGDRINGYEEPVALLTKEQYQNRMTLQKAMIRNGFKPLNLEWWHFTLENEPYPDTNFDFPVSSAYLRK